MMEVGLVLILHIRLVAVENLTTIPAIREYSRKPPMLAPMASATAMGPGVGMTMAWPTMVPAPRAHTKGMMLRFVSLATYLTMGIMMMNAASI